MAAGEVLPQKEIERLLCMMSHTPQSDENRDSGILSKAELNALFGTTSQTGAIPMPDESDRKQPIGEVLSSTEVENLLGVMCPVNAPKHDEKKDTAERLDKKQMRTLQLMHEKLARIFAAKVSSMLQSVVDVKLTSIEQLAYSTFVFSCDNPTCFNLIHVESPQSDPTIL